MMLSPHLAARAKDIGWLRDQLGPYARKATEATGEDIPEDHVIVVGHGVSGRNVVRVLEQLDVERVIVELDPFVVRELLENDERAQYGDACRMAVLERAGIEDARAIVITVPDPTSVRRIVSNAAQVNPGITILVRTRLVSEVERLHNLGADAVVPEEFETSLQLAGLVMQAYGAPEHAVEREKNLIREDNYHVLCKPDAPCPVRPTLSAMLKAVEFEEVEIPPDSPAGGVTIREFNLRKASGASISAVGRGDEVIGNPSADFTLQEGDSVFLFGSGEQLADALEYIQQPTQ
jgi:CPA2 family monovalent cation:H+ antiporter-2